MRAVREVLLTGPHIQHTDHALIVVEQWQRGGEHILFEDAGGYRRRLVHIEGGGAEIVYQHVAGASGFGEQLPDLKVAAVHPLTCAEQVHAGVGCSARGLGRWQRKVGRQVDRHHACCTQPAGQPACRTVLQSEDENHRGARRNQKKPRPTNSMSWCHDASEGFHAESDQCAGGPREGGRAGCARLAADRAVPGRGDGDRNGRGQWAAAYFFPDGEFVIGILIMVLFVFSDMLDGTMARLQKRTGVWGAFLDSTLDRVADGVIFGSVLIWAVRAVGMGAGRGIRLPGRGFVISYARARAESVGLDCKGHRRAHRTPVDPAGPGVLLRARVPYLLPAALFVLAILVLITVWQRFAHVYRQAMA